MTAISAPDERALRAAWRGRRRAATAALVLGIVATLLPAGVTGGAYLIRDSPGGQYFRVSSDMCVTFVGGARRNSLFDLVGHDAAWTAVVASLVVLPLWFWFWRRSAMSAARTIGVVQSLATSAGIVGLAQIATGGPVVGVAWGLYWLHVAAGLCFTAAFAFALAPPPRE